MALLHCAAQIDQLAVQLHAVDGHPRCIEQVVDEPGHAADLALHDGLQWRSLRSIGCQLFPKAYGMTHGGDRAAQFVADGREQFVRVAVVGVSGCARRVAPRWRLTWMLATSLPADRSAAWPAPCNDSAMFPW